MVVNVSRRIGEVQLDAFLCAVDEKFTLAAGCSIGERRSLQEEFCFSSYCQLSYYMTC
jgi:hypothetical protein